MTERASGDLPDDFSQRGHRRLIGCLGLVMPVLVYLVAGIRPTKPLPAWDLLDSVSAYYYTGGVAIFVGVVFALSLFLFTYQGYQGVKADRRVGKLAGAAAMGVVLFPTDPPNAELSLAWWYPAIGKIHYVSAVVLFGSFILFSVWLFRKSKDPKGRRPAPKRRRDRVYLVCGIVMAVAVLWAAASRFTDAPIFIPEAIAIEAFAVSWLVKGEAHEPVVAAVRRLRKR